MKRKDTQLTKHQILYLTQFAMLLAIEMIVCFTPFLGAIKIGPISATLAMIPVVIAGIVLGPYTGTILGFFAGAFSFIYWTFIEPGNPTAIMFTPFHSYGEISSYWTILICFVPRMLTGLVAGFLAQGLKKTFPASKQGSILAFSIAGIVGSFVNTLLVLFGTYFLWGRDYCLAMSMEYTALMGIIGTTILINGIPEAILAGILGSAIGYPLVRYIVKKEH